MWQVGAFAFLFASFLTIITVKYWISFIRVLGGLAEGDTQGTHSAWCCPGGAEEQDPP